MNFLKTKRCLIISLLLAVVLVTAGCAGLSDLSDTMRITSITMIINKKDTSARKIFDSVIINSSPRIKHKQIPAIFFFTILRPTNHCWYWYALQDFL
jgi:hypothetical protein